MAKKSNARLREANLAAAKDSEKNRRYATDGEIARHLGVTVTAFRVVAPEPQPTLNAFARGGW